MFLDSKKCFGFWDAFLDSGKCFGFWDVFLDSGKCFWILGSVLDILYLGFRIPEKDD